MRDGWLLVPLTSKFAFISPSKLVIVMPLLAILPVALLLLTSRRGIRAAAVWYGGCERGAATRGDDGADVLERAADVLQLHLSSDGRDRAGTRQRQSPALLRQAAVLQP